MRLAFGRTGRSAYYRRLQPNGLHTTEPGGFAYCTSLHKDQHHDQVYGHMIIISGRYRIENSTVDITWDLE